MPKFIGVLMTLAMSSFMLSATMAASDSLIITPKPCFSLSGCPSDNAVQIASLPAAANNQQTQATPPPQPTPGSIPRSSLSNPTPMTDKEKFHWYLRTTYGPKSFIYTAVGSAIGQARDNVSEWGQGWDAYATRFGSNFGQKMIKRSFALGLKTAFHEDPRYFMSGQTGILDRSLYAAKQVFIAHKDNGGTRPNFTWFASTFGGSYISRQWHPDSYHTWGDYLSSFGMSIGLDMAKNAFNEFWPDIRKRLHF
jgi:hypothetical protein